MEFSGWTQKLHSSVTAITWIGFLIVCAVFGSYAFLLRNKELSTQNTELRYLREENASLTDRNRELEQQLATMEAECSETRNAISGSVETELQEKGQRSFLYTVKKGDTIWDIATLYNVDVNALMRWNNLTPRSQIFPGDQLTIILEE